MKYFSERNGYVNEYSGHEEVSENLRSRLDDIIKKYVGSNASLTFGNDDPWDVDISDFKYQVRQKFPNKDPFNIIKEGRHHEVFTVVEIFLCLTREIYFTRKKEAPEEIRKAFLLSGSVYQVSEEYQIELKIDKDAAEKINSMQIILAPYQDYKQRFLEAVGNLVARKSKPENVVKDVFVAAEGYLKEVTNTSSFGDAVKFLSKKDLINREQKKVMEAIHGFSSDTDGTRHAGNSPTPTEENALWFLETIIAQLRMIDKKQKSLPQAKNSL